MTYYLGGPSLVIGGAGTPQSWIMYENKMIGATVNSGGDVGRLCDWMTNIFYTAAAGTTTIELTIASGAVNCVAVAGVNWDSGGVEIEFSTWNGSSYDVKCELIGQKDGQPVMRVFDSVGTTKVKFVITCTDTLYIGEAAFGEALQMPSCPAVGYQPAQWSDNDELSISQTQSLNFGASTVERRGSTEVLPFNFIPYQFMYGEWALFRENAKGKPIWIGFNQKDLPDAVIFGHWKQSTPKFDSSYFSSIQLTIDGVV